MLVTHQRQFLPKCDRIAVLRQGHLIALGTWVQLLPLQLPELVGGAVTMSLDAAEEDGDEVEQASSSDEQSHEQQQQASDRAEVAGDAVAEQSAVCAAGKGDEHLPKVFQSAAAQPFMDGGAASDLAGGSSNNGSCSSEVESAEDADLKRVLSRTRTMAPDVNWRPADSGRAPSRSLWGSGSSMNPTKSIGNFLRIISRKFSRKELDSLNASRAAAVPGAKDQQGLGMTGSGGIMQTIGAVQFAVTRSISSLFIPPAYLPPNPYEVQEAPSAAAAPTRHASGKFSRQESWRGLALLGPVRSLVLAHQVSLQRGLGISPVPAGGKAGTGSGAADAAVAGQLVVAEKRETGSVSWDVYGSYAKQVGLATSVFMMAALVLGQGVYVAADWWLAKWAASPPAQQMQPR